MTQENPTAGNSDASIEDRLMARLFPAESPPEQTTEQTEAPATEAQTAVETEKPDNDDQAKDTQPQFTTAQLAQILGLDETDLDVEEDGSVIFKTKVDGKEGKAKLADFRKTYQLQGHAENETRKAAEIKKAAEQRVQEVEQHVQSRLQQVEDLNTVAARELLAQYNSVNWDALRQQDAGQYAALKADFAERNAKIQGALQAVRQDRAKAFQGYEQQRQAFLQKEAEKLTEVIPEWKDATVKAKESAEILEWGQKQGLTTEQLRALNESSALQIAMVRKAMQYDKLQQKKPEIENKVRTAPLIVKPGQARANTQAEKMNALRDQVRKTGGKNGALEALLVARMK